MNKLYLTALIFLSSINCKTTNPNSSKKAARLALQRKIRARKKVVKAKVVKQLATEKQEDTKDQAHNNRLISFNEPKNQPVFKISSPTNPNWSIGFEVTYTDNGSVTYPQQLNKYDYNPNNPYGYNFGSNLNSFNNYNN